MRNKIKSVLSIFLVLIMVVSVFPVIGIQPEASAVSGNEIIAYARQFIGCAYVSKASGPSSFDCSGFTMYVFGHFGISLPHSTQTMWNNPTAYGTVVGTGSTANAQAGDLILWYEHVAIYTENGKCVEALNSKYGVTEAVSVNSHTNGTNYKVIRVYGVNDNTQIPGKPVFSEIYVKQPNNELYLSWNATQNTSSYNLFIYNVSDKNNPVGSYWDIRNTYFTVYLPEGKYVAKLCSANFTSEGSYYTEGDYSSQFTVTYLPEKPAFSEISVKSTYGEVDLSWNTTKNTNSYNLFIYNISDLNNPVESYWDIRNTWFSVYLPNGTYVAKLCSAKFTSDGSYYTEGDFSWQFTVNNTPSKPHISSIDIKQDTGETTFYWNALSNATCYNLFIYNTLDLDNPIQNHWAIRKNNLTTVLPNGTYIAILWAENENEHGNYYTEGDKTKIFTIQTDYIISFNANGGSCSISSKSVTYNSTYGTLPTPTRTGYTFDGWYTSSTGGTKITAETKVTITEDQTLYAHWEHDTFVEKSEISVTVADKFIFGENLLKMTDIELASQFSNSNINVSMKAKRMATGTTVNLIDDKNTVYDTLTVCIFGDTNCDGWYDGTDAVLVNMLANGMLTKEQVGEAVYMAADCNNDGVIDDNDVKLLEQAGLLLESVDQNKSQEELKTDSDYIEYLNLIEQNVADEVNTEENSSELYDIVGFLADIYSFVKNIIAFLKSILI